MLRRVCQALNWLSTSSCPRHVRRNAVAMVTVVSQQKYIEHSAANGVWRPNARTNLMKFDTQQQIRTPMRVRWRNIKLYNIQDGEWAHHSMFPTYRPWCGGHGNGCCL